MAMINCCLNCDAVIQYGDQLCEKCQKEFSRKAMTTETIERKKIEEQARDSKVLMGEIVKHVAGKHPNVSLNALGTIVGTIIGQIDHPAHRKKVRYNFDKLLDEATRMYTTKNIQAQYFAAKKKFEAEHKDED